MEGQPVLPIKAERLLLITLLLLALIARLLPGPRTVDDAYITFRYARNLVEGRGFVYNPEERVLGTTTPLYTLVLAALAAGTGVRDFPLLAMAVNAFAGALAVLVLHQLARRFFAPRPVAPAAALLWAVAPFSVTFAIGGMETDLTIALILGTFLAHLAGRARWMALLAALAFLARPDTAIATAPLFLDLWLARRRPPWREAGILAAALAPWLLFATFYFGSPLPASITAKSVTYRLPPAASLISLLQRYATPFFESQVLPPTGVLAIFAVYVGLSALGASAAFRRSAHSWPISIYPLAYAAVFAVANPLLFRWYFSPPLPVYFLLLLCGAWQLTSDLTHTVARGMRRWRGQAGKATGALFAILTAAMLCLTLNAWTLRPDHGPDRPAPEMAWFKLELLYREAAAEVMAEAQEGDTLCAGDIGVLGYRTGLHILDTVGLVTPEASRFYPAEAGIYVINYAIPADLVLALEPDYVVILEVYGRRSLLVNPRFQEHYRLLRRIETDIYGSKGMLVFARDEG